MAMDLDQLTSKYILLRDVISEEEAAHKQALAPKKQLLEDMAALLTQKLQALKIDSAASPMGTVYLTQKKSASIADQEAFWKFVVDNQAWDLVDKRANKVAVEDYINQFHQLPPGVNFTMVDTVGVRRKSGT